MGLVPVFLQSCCYYLLLYYPLGHVAVSHVVIVSLAVHNGCHLSLGKV